MVFLQAANNTATGNAPAEVTIYKAITITPANGTTLNFGNVIPGTGSGTLALNPANSAATATGLNVAAGNAAAPAVFNVAGQPSAAFAVSFPSGSITLTDGTPAHDMTVNPLTASINSGTASSTPSGTLDGSGAQVVTVGGTLNVAGGQADGHYTGTVSVTVTYN
jgi:spore coat protein U-like protein